MTIPQFYTIQGVKVQFPCKAYPSQLSMMDKIIKGIDRQHNCLLESPTGSGKSLALLCSALAWQFSERDKLQQEENKVGSCCCKCHDVDSSLNSTFQQPVTVDISDNSVDLETSKISNIGDCEDDDDDDDFQTAKPKSCSKRKKATASAEKSFALEMENLPKWTMAERSDCSKVLVCECSCGTAEKKKPRLPKIYFGTRTHKQVAQIIREMGKTAYGRTRMTILSSRDHTCIHSDVARSSNRNEACKELLDGQGCRYSDRAKRMFTHSCLESNGLGVAWDIEDIVTFAKKKQACSYFGARQLRDSADIVFCPYNYLIDPIIRKSMDISLKGQIVILDEAHNIEDSSRDAASFIVTQDQLNEAAKDLRIISSHSEKQMQHLQLAQMCDDLSHLIDDQKSHFENSGFDGASKVWTGADIVAQLELRGITASSLKELEGLLLSITEKDSENEKQKKSIDYKIKSSTSSLLDGLFVVLNFIYKENFKFVDDYRVAIVKIFTYRNTDNKWIGKRRRNMNATWTFQLNFWCMNPAVAFTDMSHQVRCIILTSGTLSPMNSFQSELGIKFPIQLEANHVIADSQVWIASISRGPTNLPLLGSYQNAETLAYQDEIGELLLQVCQTVPHGVLCFLPSYKAMEKMTKRWEEIGILHKIMKIKIILHESRSSEKDSFDAVLKDFYEAIENSNTNNHDHGGINGALLFAVCRGKVSEGLDFANNNARAVVAVGIPFPNIKDTQVLLKKKYNDARSQSKGLLCGSDWYEIQAYRALNQALGRCIRHRLDWGALILVDERFVKNPQKYTSGLSKWVRQRMQYYSDFPNALRSLKQFTHNRLCDTPIQADSGASNVSSINTPQKLSSMLPDESFTLSLQDDHDLSFAENSGTRHRILTSTPLANKPFTLTMNKAIGKITNEPSALSLFTKITKNETFSASSSSPQVPNNTQLYQQPSSIVQPVVTLSISNDPGEQILIDNERKEAVVNRITKYLNPSQAGGFLPDSQLLSSLAVTPDIKDSQTDVHNTETDTYITEMKETVAMSRNHESKSYIAACHSPDLFDCMSTEDVNEEFGPVLREVEGDSQDYDMKAATPEDVQSRDILLQDLKKNPEFEMKLEENTLQRAVPLGNNLDSKSNNTLERKIKCRNRKSSFEEYPYLSIKKMKTESPVDDLEDDNDHENEQKQKGIHEELSCFAIKSKTDKCLNFLGQNANEKSYSRKSKQRKILKKASENRGVDFIDELDTEDFGCSGNICCPLCFTRLTLESSKVPSTCFTKETTFRPLFWKELLRESRISIGNCNSTAITLDRCYLQETAFSLETDKPSNGNLKLTSSYWSEVDGCCVQLVFCSFCKVNNISTCLGAEVKAVSQSHSHRLHPNQVWLVSDCLKERLKC